MPKGNLSHNLCAMEADYIRKKIIQFLLNIDQIEFNNKIPTDEKLIKEFENIDTIGLYIHIPFCDQICPYCPYNKEVFREASARQYVKALQTEIDRYAIIAGNTPVTTFYIGGGTPTSILDFGLEEILNHVFKRFNMQCTTHIESHPNHLSQKNLKKIKDLGVEYLSVGVEALQDQHLESLKRNYTVEKAKRSIRDAMDIGFKCVNMDFMFDLPGQTDLEIEQAAKQIVALNVDQIATYPLFNFEYAHMKQSYRKKRRKIPTMFRRRKLLKILESHFYPAEYDRSSVWAFTKKRVDKYCSVTVPTYIGLGASGSSYLNGLFSVNTFRVRDYTEAIQRKQLPIAVSIDLSPEMQKLGWLYWRFYETKFKASDFEKRFGKTIEDSFGKYLKALKYVGFLKRNDDGIQLTNHGSYWIHAFEDFFSISYINNLWGQLRKEPWPKSIIV